MKRLLILILLPACLFSQEEKKEMYFCGSAFIGVSFFDNDERVTGEASGGRSLGATVRGEKIFKKGLQLAFGLEVLRQSQTIHTYYFYPGHTVIFDKNFNYSHEISFLELSIPVFIKIPFEKRPQDRTNTGYALIGWAPKMIVNAETQIKSLDTDDNLYSGNARLEFEHQMIAKGFGSNLSAGVGFDHKFGKARNSLYVESIFRYGISRYLYTGREDSNRVLFKNSSLTFGVGYRF